jgi:Outer membrane receptor for ferrienterochelin and colicins
VSPVAPTPRVRIPGLFAGPACSLLLLLAPAASAQSFPSAHELKTMSLDDLLEVQVISVSRTPEDWRTTPTAINVLTAEDIRRSSAVRLADIFRIAPGFHVGRNAGSEYAINARGFSSAVGNKMEVLMDGRSLYTPLFAGVAWNVQDTLLLDIARIETVRGPGAALWGANAVNGVINIVTKSADETQGLLVTGGAGNEERAFAALRYGDKLGVDTYYRAYLKHVERDDLILPDGSSAHDALRQTQAGFRLDSYPSAADHFTAQGELYFNRTDLLTGSHSRNEGGSLLGRWTHGFGTGSEFQLQAYYQNDIRDVPALFYEDRHTAELELFYRSEPAPCHQLVLGAHYRYSHDRTGNGRPYVFDPPRRTLHLVGGFIQDDITLVPHRLLLSLGSKFEHNDFTGFEMQPKLALAFHPSKQHTLWASVSRAVRTPTRAEDDARYLPDYNAGAALFRGDRDFTSETLVAFETGYRVQPRDNLFIDLALFFNRYDDLRTFSFEPPVDVLVLRNRREGDTRGGELIVTWQPAAWWRLTASYAYIDEHLYFEPGVIDPTDGFFETNDAPHLAKLTSALNLRGGFEIDFTLRYVDRLPNPYVPSYVELDLRLAWRPNDRLELAVVGRNLLDASHPEFSAAASPVELQRGGYLQATWHY